MYNYIYIFCLYIPDWPGSLLQLRILAPHCWNTHLGRFFLERLVDMTIALVATAVTTTEAEPPAA